MKIGIQLYSVKNELQKDFKGTLSALASIGFQGVEFAWNYGGMEPEELKSFLDEIGLECVGVYSPVKEILEAESNAYKYAEGLGASFFTTGITDKVNKDEWPGAIDEVKNAARLSASKGISFLYHNHWQEFEKIDGKYGLDILMEECDPETVNAEFDTAWIKKGGDDPATYIKKYSGRMPCLHVKDIDSENDVIEIGNGTLDFVSIVKTAKECGVKWLIYELDKSSIGELESAKISFNRIKETGV
jgi:sugar phosphate isomerase/epimerase